MMKFSTLLLVASVAMVANGSTVRIAKEFEGFTYLGRSSDSARAGIQAKDYYLSHMTGSHYDGELQCRSTFGGQLAIILTEQQNTDLRMWTAIPANQISCAHIGGTRASGTSTWFWQSGSNNIPIQRTFWQAGEPRSGNCVCVHGLGVSFGWHSCVCEAAGAYRYICEL